MKLGDYLRRKREAAGWTQPEAAARAGVEQSYISKLETGRSYPSEEVYTRLLAALDIDTGDLIEQVDAAELDKLREVQTVRAALLKQTAKTRTLSRGWMLAGLFGLVMGGGLFMAGLSAEHDETMEFLYESQGVLMTHERLTEFDLAQSRLVDPGQVPEDRRAELETNNARIIALRERLDPVQRVLETSRGDAFIEATPEGRRYFRQVEDRLRSTPSPLRWLMPPGLALLLGALGCFFISLRWK